MSGPNQTSPICPECLRLGSFHEKYALLNQPHHVVITRDGECPECGCVVCNDIPWCRVCEVFVATEPGQLCEGCASYVRPHEVTQAEIDRLDPITPTSVLCGFKTEPGDDIDYGAAAEAFYAW